MLITDWTDAYAIGAHMPGSDDVIAAWTPRSRRLQEAHPPTRLRYGGSDRHYVDLYRPGDAPRGLVVFVHGGYWQALSGDDFGFIAEGALARGYAVGVVTYRLAPEVRISEITGDVRAAVLRLAEEIDGPIFLTGHSAGGHLVARMGCEGVMADTVAGRVAHIVPVAGLHDLRPILKTEMNGVLNLDEQEAMAESPALLRPWEGLRVTCVAGTEERPELRRQSELLVNIWTGLGADMATREITGRHHFDILDDLSSQDGEILRILLD